MTSDGVLVVLHDEDLDRTTRGPAENCTGPVGEKTLKGKEAVRQHMKSTYLEPPKFSVDQLIAEGAFVTAVGDIDIKDETGQVAHFAYCDVWRIRDGKLADLRAFVVEIKGQD